MKFWIGFFILLGIVFTINVFIPLLITPNLSFDVSLQSNIILFGIIVPSYIGMVFVHGTILHLYRKWQNQ